MKKAKTPKQKRPARQRGKPKDHNGLTSATSKEKRSGNRLGLPTGKSMVIVESPAKVKTLNKILGEKYQIRACYGHIRDLPRSKFGLNIKKDFKPKYQIIQGRPQKLVAELKKETEKANRVFLASDPDREGEAIAWHLVEALELSLERVRRVSFNEITPQAVRAAFDQPSQISLDKVNAQQTRRFLDRIVGYKLSPLLWRKIGRGLSAGRVQSVAVKFIVEREKEITKFKPQEYWKITARLSNPQDVSGIEISTPLTELNGDKIGSPAAPKVKIWLGSESAAKNLVAHLDRASFRVARISERKTTQLPPPPFITSTLQQQASTRLGFSAKQTMFIAQQLYEGIELPEGSTALITYLRTDSRRVSPTANNQLREFITRQYGEKYLNKTVRTYKSRKQAQEAHEAIRPTYIEKTPEQIKEYLSPKQYKLYNLIWRQFVATQMKPAIWINRSVQIESVLPELVEIEIFRRNEEAKPIQATINVQKCVFSAEERKLLFKGYLLLFDTEEQLLPTLAEGEKLQPIEFSPAQNFTQPPPRYNEASLVRTLEKYGIGRPSTYAPIISTIQERGYVKKTGRQFVATDLGILVTDKLLPYFADILNTKFTSKMEKKLDLIEDAKADWIKTLREFYQIFSKDLEKASAEMTKEKGGESAGKEKCEKCGKPMVVRWSRHGQFLACSGYPDCKFIISLKPPEPVQPTKEVCEKCGRPMVIRRSKKKHTSFLACSGYPECKNTKSLHTISSSSDTTE